MKKIIYFILFACIGSGAFAQICPGTEGQLQWESYFGIWENKVNQTFALHQYPTNPDVTKTIYRIQSPINYGNGFGARIRGYINVPQETTVTFNVTGDDNTLFYLSTNELPENKILQCYVQTFSSIEEHDKFPEQTSSSITLLPNVNYYFELLNAEGTGGDHCSLYWKTDLVDSENWNIVTSSFIRGVDCLDPPCPEGGTPCDDGDSTTTNDIEDGFCHCKGEPETSNSCVGERGLLEAYRFEGIPGGDINDLYEAPNYPGTPDYGYQLNQFSRPFSNEIQDFGEQVQAFLSVPESGLYKFNVTGDDNTIMFLSSDDDPANKQAHMAIVSNNTGMVEHDKYIWQSTSFLYLEANEYYYIELNFKHGSGGEHYSIFWQTPFTEDGVWKRIPEVHFYDYGCEVACIPAGTPCDDGDPFTNNDVYDAQCNCAGTPCSGPDCDSPLANYVPYEKCNVTNQIGNNPETSGLSCSIDENPNDTRDSSHWIVYDLGERYELHQTHVWNYNVENETDRGFQSVVIDYSLDGVTWNEFGQYTWPEAPGDNTYSGFSGPDFQGTFARYILITTLDNSPACKGIGKVSFAAVLCPLTGTACDDNDSETVNDIYDDNCECKGKNLFENECDEVLLALGDSTIYSDVFSAETYVSSISNVAPENTVSMIAGSAVTLNPGFETGTDAIFLASIDTCETQTGGLSEIMPRSKIVEMLKKQAEIDKTIPLQVLQNKNSEDVKIKFFLKEAGDIKLIIKDQNDQIVFTILDNKLRNKGLFQKNINTRKFNQGSYIVELTTQEGIHKQALHVL